MAGKVRVGCSGWAYASWRPGFYPLKTPLKKLLEAYASRLNTVEVNYTFRSLPSASTAANWLAQSPSQFHFAFKAPQRITHIRRLVDAGEALERFQLSLAPFAEAGRLGPVLFQLPPKFTADPGRLRSFLDEAAPSRLQSAWEFRDASWFAEPVLKILADHGAVLCAAESDSLRSPDLALVAGLRVFRLRRSQYSTEELAALAEHFSELARGGADVYAFFMHEEAPDGPLRAAEVLAQIPQELRG
ncbi:DUF72 domain-containing protein [Acidipila sp. EB88]|uniref:DUF72 domain-containing protein n=1 Tax=Acidipila sp. EB88 TaxID=2305226 RepID=UPI000F5EFA20|nr:DUF72 domain-containing protein [Acidipila sp. EB88]RRA47888.1 DUF72 domain-containing protein [Acidipila sp. EB88]